MTLETFFEKFDLFADAPDAVAKMREVVRHLAVTGKLVSQDRNDEPASGLLRRLESAKERLAAEQGVRSPKNVPALKSQDHPHDIPESWQWCRIGHLAVVIDYGTSQKSDSDSSKVPVYRMGNIIGGRLIDENLKYVDASIDDLPALYLKTHDILFNRTNSYELVGKTGIFTGRDNTATFASYLIRIRLPDTLLLPAFFSLAMNAPYFRQTQIEPEVVQQCGQANFNGTKLASTVVPVPPLAEQKRIVAKVDELMALCDRLEAQQQERTTRHAALARASLARFADAPTPANLEYLFHSSFSIPPSDLRKSILTLAVQGKLVPQDPNDEPAEEIVSRIEAKSTDGAEAPVDETEMPWFLPSCWQWVRLGTIANIKHGYAFSSESFTSEPTRYVLTTPGNFYESGGFRDRGANTKYFNGDVPPAFVFNPRDLIIPMTEQAAGLLGSPAFIPDDGKTYLHNQRLGKLEFYSDEVAPEYVFWFFNSEFFRSELARTCTGMKVRHTSPKRILRVPFALPPLAEQRRIVAKVDELMALVDALETQLATARTTASRLLDAAVAELTLKGGGML